MNKIIKLIPVPIGIIFVILLLTVFSANAYASCSNGGNDFDDFQRATVVFSGTVIDIYNPHANGTHTPEHDYTTISFDVDRVFKGDIKDGIVRTDHGSSEYTNFVVGKSYYVYAFGTLMGVSQCTPPILLNGYDKVWVELGIIPAITPTTITISLVPLLVLVLLVVYWKKQ